MVAVRIAATLCVLGCASSSAQDKSRVIERAADLPQHTYRVGAEPGQLVVDAAAFAELARTLRADLEGDLARFDIRDPELKKDHLFNLSILDALDGHWDLAIQRLDQAAALEPKPSMRIMTGLTIRVWAAAVKAGQDDASGFRTALQQKLATMPIDVVGGELRQLVTLANLFSPQFCKGVVDLQIGPVARQGPIPLDLAEGIVFQRWAYLRLIQVAPAVVEVVSPRLEKAR